MARTYKDQARYMAKQMIRSSFVYAIARMKDNGQWEMLERFGSYDAADERYDYWVDRYPAAYIDIVSAGELNKVPA